ncbi:RrF2 family transcriptional regulator [Halanaerobacter jeridensis]|uniref:Rrf2 family protein n=1 Tax=Halanaerobacter jeridensis TaxID=706427 RepID=A0A938XU44_9FIRM|nr:Rrf2 family transcriptional regulator [Halanaerobacter jeridensis]MBM7557560.1 Rrf2 family protein [Halanaerobacter jeridensis]
MKLSQASDYAFRAVLYLAKQGVGNRVDAQTISEVENIPKRFLLKTFRKLAQTDIIESYRGKYGGYALAKDPADVTLLDVVEAVEGPIEVNRCLVEPEACNKQGADTCRIHHALYDVRETITDKLKEYTFAKLLAE